MVNLHYISSIHHMCTFSVPNELFRKVALLNLEFTMDISHDHSSLYKNHSSVYKDHSHSYRLVAH